MDNVTIIGAGLAGSEAAYQLAKRGIKVKLYEMRPKVMTPAHHTGDFSELVCSNSLRGDSLLQGVGVLKEEMRKFSSIIIKTAEETKVPAGNALAVDRESFSKTITAKLKNMPNIEIIEEEVIELPSGPLIIATGPLTSERFVKSLTNVIDEDTLYFYDAAAPIVEASSIDLNICYKKSRYDKGTADYLNCPMNQEEYLRFYQALIEAKCTAIKDFELKVFEGCMPIEEMARRGEKTLLFGPLKPVGLDHDLSKRSYAVVQLRQDNAVASLYNLVGFQTHMTFQSQERVIKMIPGLSKAVIVRYGVMHRNTYINAPKVLNANYRLKNRPFTYIAGQLSGVEGYVESASSGLVAAISLLRELKNKPQKFFPKETMLGALGNYLENADSKHFQPMNANFGILEHTDFILPKKEKKPYLAKRALQALEVFMEGLDD